MQLVASSWAWRGQGRVFAKGRGLGRLTPPLAVCQQGQKMVKVIMGVATQDSGERV